MTLYWEKGTGRWLNCYIKKLGVWMFDLTKKPAKKAVESVELTNEEVNEVIKMNETQLLIWVAHMVKVDNDRFKNLVAAILFSYSVYEALN
jgi:hypothetical protein